MGTTLQIRDNIEQSYGDVYTPEALEALEFMARYNGEQKALMEKRTQRRKRRCESKERITFLDPDSLIPRTSIRVQDARDGKFEGRRFPTTSEDSGYRERARPRNRTPRLKKA